MGLTGLTGDGVLELAEDPGPDLRVGWVEGHAADEAADGGLARVGWVAAGVAGGVEQRAQEGGEALDLARRSRGFGV